MLYLAVEVLPLTVIEAGSALGAEVAVEAQEIGINKDNCINQSPFAITTHSLEQKHDNVYPHVVFKRQDWPKIIKKTLINRETTKPGVRSEHHRGRHIKQQRSRYTSSSRPRHNDRNQILCRHRC